jgi:ABC-2 type transport system ATP-binding protein
MLTTRVIPTGGRAFVGGIDVVAHPVAAKQVIGVVPQTNTLDRSLSVWENLYFHGRFFGMSARTSHREADRLLERFRLDDRAKVPVLTLSGGMAQRLMVARAIMHKPAILFLDEPTAGLDPSSARLVKNLVRQAAADGAAVFVTTHDMSAATELCDEVGFLVDGRLAALGPPRELMVAHGRRTVAVTHRHSDGGLVTEEFPLDGLGGSVRFGQLVSSGTIETIHSTEATLEDVFLVVTGRELT